MNRKCAGVARELMCTDASVGSAVETNLQLSCENSINYEHHNGIRTQRTSSIQADLLQNPSVVFFWMTDHIFVSPSRQFDLSERTLFFFQHAVLKII